MRERKDERRFLEVQRELDLLPFVLLSIEDPEIIEVVGFKEGR